MDGTVHMVNAFAIVKCVAQLKNGELETGISINCTDKSSFRTVKGRLKKQQQSLGQESPFVNCEYAIDRNIITRFPN